MEQTQSSLKEGEEEVSQSEPSVEVSLDQQPLISQQWIRAPRSAVFDFLVDAEKLSRWLGTFEARPAVGEDYTVSIGPEHVARGTFVSIEPDERVVFSWGWDHAPEVPPGSTTVTITLSDHEGGTSVVLRHDGLPMGPEDQHAVGWRDCLARLVEQFDES